MPLRRGCCGSTWLPILLILVCINSFNGSPTKYRQEAQFRNGFGSNYKGISQVTGIPFSVGENGTIALCELSFSTDLEQIYSASVSCRPFYDNTAQPVKLGLTDYDWIFYANIGGEIQEVFASIKVNPSSEVVSVLWLCFDSTCAVQESVTAMPSTVCDCESETSSSTFYSSEPEGFVFTFSSNGASSSSAPGGVTGDPFIATATGATTDTTTIVTTGTMTGTTADSSGLGRNLGIVDGNLIQQMKNIEPNNWGHKKNLERSLCLRYPPSSSSSSSCSSSSSSSSFSSSSPLHSTFRYISSSYVSYESSCSSSTSWSSSSPDHSEYISIASPYCSSSSSSSCGCSIFEWPSSTVTNPWSSISYSSSVPEGFVLNFGSEAQQSSSSSSAIPITTTTITTTTATTTTTTTTTTTHTAAQATNSQGSVI